MLFLICLCSLGHNMVLVKRICSPERRKALISVSASPSVLELSINDPSDLHLVITLRIASSTRPDKPITINTKGTVFARSIEGGTLDIIARGTAYLVSASDPRRRINLGNFRTNDLSGHWGSKPSPVDLKELFPDHLLTIPAKNEIKVSQSLSLGRIFQHEQTLKPQDVVGEEWRLGLQEGFVGTTWWCWGDLDGDLRDSRLSAWHEGLRSSSTTQKPDAADTESGRWMTGGVPAELVFEDWTSDAAFRFVE